MLLEPRPGSRRLAPVEDSVGLNRPDLAGGPRDGMVSARDSAPSRASTAVAQSRAASMRWRTRLAVSASSSRSARARPADPQSRDCARHDRRARINVGRGRARTTAPHAWLTPPGPLQLDQTTSSLPKGQRVGWLRPRVRRTSPPPALPFSRAELSIFNSILRVGGFRSEASRARFPDQSPDLMSSPGHARSSGGRAAGTRDREIGGRARGRPRRPRCRGGAGGDNAASSRR